MRPKRSPLAIEVEGALGVAARLGGVAAVHDVVDGVVSSPAAARVPAPAIAHFSRRAADWASTAVTSTPAEEY